MDFSDFLVDYVDKYYIKTTEMFNIVSIIIGMFIGLIAISNYVPNFPWFLPKEGVVIIILILMIVGLKFAPRSGVKTNRKVLEIKRCIMIDPQHVDNLDSSKRVELLNQLDLVFERKDEKALERCKNILCPTKI
ncbi:MAG: hypothetical protein ABI342_04070 [Nitrososphaera sp.]|jgi:hypothetical protein